MSVWDDAADWFAHGVETGSAPFNLVASDTVVHLLGDVRGAHLLDVGCGEGHVARRLATAGARVVGIDPTRRLLDRASKRERTEALGIHYRLDRAEALATVNDGPFDAVVACLVLHHLEDVAAALGRCHDVLRSAGRIVMIVPHPWTDSPGAGWADVDGRLRRVGGDYYREGHWAEAAPGPGGPPMAVRQIGWHHRTLSTWMALFDGARFRVDAIVEPTVDHGPTPWVGTPRLLALRGVAE